MNFDALKNTLVAALNEEGLTEYEIYYMSDYMITHIFIFKRGLYG